MNLNQNCKICGQLLNEERIEALKILNILPQNYLCIECSTNLNRTYKAIWVGPTGASNLILADNLGQYGILKNKEEEINDNIDDDELNLSDEIF